MTNTIVYHVGDVRDAMAHLDDGMVALVVTSPPFLALRSYLPDDHPEKHREIGSEATPAAFLDTMLGLTADWRRVVADWRPGRRPALHLRRTRGVMSTAVDPFGGPGGWDIAAADLGIDVEGIEFDHAACGTRRAAGLRTIEADVAQCDPHIWADVDGLIMSPPCQAFSSAGKGKGRDHITTLAAAIHRRDWAARPDPDPKVWLVLEVGRWYEAIRPEWVALEQVPAVLPLWEAYAAMLRADGYSVWCGLLCAADYGVPQTRTRAILMAHRSRPVHPPAATHAERPQASLFGTLRPWVSAAEALPELVAEHGTEWSMTAMRGAGMTDRYGERPDRPATAPPLTLRANGGGNATPGFVIRTGRGQGAYDTEDGRQEVGGDRPAPTVTAKSGGQWTIRTGQNSAQGGGTTKLYERTIDEAAPTVTGQARSWVLRNGAQANATVTRWCSDDGETVRLTVEQALVLQGFPRYYPVQGGKTKAFEQVGNAIPPPLAHAILAQLVDAQEAAA